MVPSPARPPALPPFLASLRNALGSGTESNPPAPTRQLPVQRRHPHAQTLSYLLNNRTGLRQILDRLGAKTPDCPGNRGEHHDVGLRCEAGDQFGMGLLICLQNNRASDDL